jgi:alkanesulfonate monooxygenase SsuD/methylene tetrahydromethanopterin reductase-like flavin-dependent oxidoreductase (luciferase family)
VRVGFGSIMCPRYPGDPCSDGERYRDALALAEEAERLGVDSVWASEHHFFDDSHLPSVLPFCAAMAARTSRVTIGTDVLLAPLYEPVRLAEDATTVDLLSGGRFVLGLAQGWRPEEFEGLGIPLKGRHRRPRGRGHDATAGVVRGARHRRDGRPLPGRGRSA